MKQQTRAFSVPNWEWAFAVLAGRDLGKQKESIELSDEDELLAALAEGRKYADEWKIDHLTDEEPCTKRK
jgi:hypothetical protein